MPATAHVLFLAALFWALYWTWKAWRSRWLLYVLLGWGAFQAALAAKGFYAVTDAMPPRPVLLLLPMVVGIVALLASPAGRRFLRRGDLLALTWLHVLRVPVEVVLHQGWQAGLVPRMLTYEGVNFDILSGISAPLIAWHLMRAPVPNKRVLLIWNVVCLLLLVNVVGRAVLSFPSPVQVLNLDEPMILVQRLPWIWLPAVIVPMVLLAHVAALLKLLRGGGE
ncbi:MAG: hypothetical protein KDB96_06170 [Flavobacteriales bacterium]|nr:hypothetical protein [Flavobacteriales bacterium]